MSGYEAPLMRKKTFVRSPDNKVISYQWEDIAEGTGVIEFCGMATKNNSTTAYILTTNKSMYSSPNFTNMPIAGCDIDFDVVYNLPKVMKGTLYVRIPVWEYQKNSYLKVTIQKVSGGVETDIGAEQTSDTKTSASVMEMFSVVMKWTIAETIFGKGDTFRVRIQGFGSADTNSLLYHNPIGSWVDPGTTIGDTSARLSIFAPFRIDT